MPSQPGTRIARRGAVVGRNSIVGQDLDARHLAVFDRERLLEQATAGLGDDLIVAGCEHVRGERPDALLDEFAGLGLDRPMRIRQGFAAGPVDELDGGFCGLVRDGGLGKFSGFDGKSASTLALASP